MTKLYEKSEQTFAIVWLPYLPDDFFTMCHFLS